MLRDFSLAALTWLILSQGLWEPLRTLVVLVLGGVLVAAALLAHHNRVDRRDAGYRRIALGAAVVSAGIAAISQTPVLEVLNMTPAVTLLATAMVGVVGTAVGILIRRPSEALPQ